MKKYAAYLCLVIILVIGTYLRFVGIFDNAFAFTYDVGRDLLAVSKIVYQLNIPLIGPTTGLPGLFYGPWWYYYLVPAFLIGGGNPQVIVGFIAICGLVTVALGYIFGKKIGSVIFGLFFAAFLSFSPPLVSLSNQIWNPNVAPLLLLLLLLVMAVLLAKKKEQKKEMRQYFYWILAGLLLGLSLDAEVVYGLLLTLSFIIFIIISYHKRALFNLPFVFGGYLVALLPRILFELRHSFIMTKTILSRNEGEHSQVFLPTWQHLVKVFAAFKSLWDETVALNNPYLGWVLLVFVLAVVILRYKKLPEIMRQFILFSLVTIATYFLSLMFFKGDIWSHYIVGIPVFYLLLLSIAITSCIAVSRVKIVISLLAVILLLLLIQPQEILARYTTSPWAGDASVYRNQLQVVDYIYQEAKGEKFNLEVYTPPVIDYTYQYLFSWYGRKKYHYGPVTDKQHLLFVIIEPDTGYEGREMDWLGQRENEGKVIKQNAFWSGIMVQTRLQ